VTAPIHDPIKVAVSLCVQPPSGASERRDGLSHRWVEALEKLNVAPVLVPNRLRNLPRLLELWAVEAILLTGGNRPPAPGAPPTDEVVPERDRTERLLIRHARAHDFPVVGVGRGAQMLHLYFGGSLRCNLDGRAHLRRSHTIRLAPWLGGATTSVVSNHDFVICPDALPAELTAFAWADDGSIEGFHHRHERILGIMWDPQPVGDQPAALLELVERCLMRQRPWLEARTGHRRPAA